MTTITCPRCGESRPIIIFGYRPIAVCGCDPWRPVIYEGPVHRMLVLGESPLAVVARIASAARKDIKSAAELRLIRKGVVSL